jgi:hypothetical protein
MTTLIDDLGTAARTTIAYLTKCCPPQVPWG